MTSPAARPRSRFPLFTAPAGAWRLGLLALALLGWAVLARSQAATDAAPAAAVTFDVLEYVVEGNSVLAVETIERAVYRFMGQKLGIADVEAAAAALQKVYRDAGFGNVTVDIPEQQVDAGAITLRVTEGRITRTRVMGSRYFSQGYILDKVAGAAEGTVPHFPTLQAQLGHVNRTADRRVAPLLRPGQQPGTTELDLVVQDQFPLHGSVGLNNQASANTSDTRLTASLRYDNLWQRDHSLGLQAVVSPQKTSEVQVLSASYTVPLGKVGQDSMVYSFTLSNSEVAAGVAGTTVFGKGRIWGVRRNFMLDIQPRGFHLLTLGADYKDFDETIEAAENQGFSTPIRYLPLSASYVGSQADDQGRWSFGAGLSLGLRGLVNRTAQFREKRYLATGGYSIVKADLTREQTLPWWGSALRLRVDAQWSSEPLISNEQFVAGGVDSVRGYLESAAAGDLGARGLFEWRSRDFAPALVERGAPKWLSSLSAVAFVDSAVVQIKRPQALQTARFRLLGSGLGLRLKAAPGLSLNLDLAWPLRDLGATASGEPRLHASGFFEF